MDIAVLTYQYVVKPTGMPDAWPAEIVNLSEGMVFPPDQRVGWVRMTQEQYLSYIATYQNAYDTYASSIPDQTPAVGENYKISGYDCCNKLVNETWYRDKIETGSYSVKVRENVYTYDSNCLIKVDTNYYTIGGNIYSTTTINYFSDGMNTYMENSL